MEDVRLDRLRSDAEVRKTYSPAKGELRAASGPNVGAYTAGKALLIADLLWK